MAFSRAVRWLPLRTWARHLRAPGDWKHRCHKGDDLRRPWKGQLLAEPLHGHEPLAAPLPLQAAKAACSTLEKRTDGFGWSQTVRKY